MNLTELVQSSGWKNFMSKLYGFGASVVIVGALFKIQHWALAGTLLTAGLLTEATIFFFSAFEPLHEEVDWTLVYPELAGMEEDEELDQIPASFSRGSSSALEKFDTLLEQGEITPDLFNKLGKGLSKLNETTERLSDISNAGVATNDYVNHIKQASTAIDSYTESYVKSTEELKESVTRLSGSYDKTANLITESGSNYQQLSESFSLIENGSKSYGEQLESLNKNMSALNAVYELQLQGTDGHLKTSDALYKNLDEMMINLRDTAEDTKKYREEVSKLGDNLSALNTIYGNMLSAMNVMGK
ncbi:MAG: gliding motility protein GldL [Bacteroidetes bacterium]|nr:gliding motility protein GldL [Bacteroidota bacterium]